MAQEENNKNKGTRKELIEIAARINELERARPYLNKDFYDERTQSLLEKEDTLKKKVESGRLAPDIQYILSEIYDEDRD
jgi:hypothetical protein